MPTPSLIDACRNVLWKLDRNEAASERLDAPTWPAKIDRRDIVIRHLREAVALADRAESERD